MTDPSLLEFEETTRRLRDAYQTVFRGPLGELVLEDLKDASGFEKDLFVPGDVSYTCYNEGARRLFLRIWSFVHMDDQKLAKITHVQLGEQTDV